MSDKKLRNSRKAEKSSKLIDRTQHVLSVTEVQDEPTNKFEPYQCSGKFMDDFFNLCKQNNLNYIPIVTQRTKRPTSPTQLDNKSDKPKLTKKASDFSQSFLTHGNQSSLLNEIPSVARHQYSIDVDAIPEIVDEFNPKTFVLVKDPYEFYKPKIQIELDNTEKQENVTDIYIRSWKITDPIMLVLQDCLPLLEKLTTLNLWNCGLTNQSIDILTKFLPKCTNLKNLILDGNPIESEPFYKFTLLENSLVQTLSVRNCGITSIGAELFGVSLADPKRVNTNLISLNLSGNFLGDKGAVDIAKALRTNRTLLVLNLSGNNIGDLGAEKIAEVLSRFQLTHEEIVKRRMQKAEKLIKEAKLGSPVSSSRKNKDADRPPSHITNVVKDRIKEKEKLKKEKSDHSLTATIPFTRDRSKSKEVTTVVGRDSSLEKNQTSNATKNKTDNKALTNSLQKKASISSDKASFKQLKSKVSKKNLRDHESVETESNSSKSLKNPTPTRKLSVTHPGDTDVLMEDVEHINGELWMPGNRVLISLNLSRNQITKFGVERFLLSIQYQTTLLAMNKNQGNGLLRLNLNKNDFDSECDAFIQLNEIMKLRDPIINRQIEMLNETVHVGSGRDTKDGSKSKTGTRH